MSGEICRVCNLEHTSIVEHNHVGIDDPILGYFEGLSGSGDIDSETNRRWCELIHRTPRVKAKA